MNYYFLKIFKKILSIRSYLFSKKINMNISLECLQLDSSNFKTNFLSALKLDRKCKIALSNIWRHFKDKNYRVMHFIFFRNWTHQYIFELLILNLFWRWRCQCLRSNLFENRGMGKWWMINNIKRYKMSFVKKLNFVNKLSLCNRRAKDCRKK